MWSLFKLTVFLGMLGAVLYGVCYIPVGGATLAEHGREIWQSHIVQSKVEKVQKGVHDELKNHLEKAREAKDIAQKTNGAIHRAQSEIPDKDRQALEDLLGKALK